MTTPTHYDPMAEALSTLRLIALESGSRGCGAREVAAELRRQQSELVPLLESQLLTDWVRKQLDRMTDESGLPLYRSVGERYVMRSFWDERSYREVIGRYVTGAERNLQKARALSEEARRVLGVSIPVPKVAYG